MMMTCITSKCFPVDAVLHYGITGSWNTLCDYVTAIAVRLNFIINKITIILFPWHSCNYLYTYTEFHDIFLYCVSLGTCRTINISWSILFLLHVAWNWSLEWSLDARKWANCLLWGWRESQNRSTTLTLTQSHSGPRYQFFFVIGLHHSESRPQRQERFYFKRERNNGSRFYSVIFHSL